MRFCKNCNNMYYLTISSEKDAVQTLLYTCRNCGDETRDSTLLGCVSETFVSKKNADIGYIMNEYTKYDQTLPHISNVKCPNSECPSNKDPEHNKRDVVYIRYDDTNMKYVYLCVVCGIAKWTNDT